MKLRLNRYKDFNGPQNPYKLWPHMGMRHYQKEPVIFHTAYQHLNHWRMRKGIHQLTKLIDDPFQSDEIKGLAHSLLVEVFLTYEDYGNMGQVLQNWQNMQDREYYRHQYFFSFLTGDWMGLAQEEQVLYQMNMYSILDELQPLLRRVSRLIEECAWDQALKLESSPQVIVILGCSLSEDGSVSPIIEQRLEAGLLLARRFPEAKLFLTGGAVANQYIESQGMKDYMLSHGVEEDRLILDIRAKDTIGNAMVLREWLIEKREPMERICLVSHAEHLPRAWMVFHEIVAQTHEISIYPVEKNSNEPNLEIASLKDLLKIQADIYRIHTFLLS